MFSRIERRKRVYLQKKAEGICSHCTKRSKKGKLLCLTHLRKAKVDAALSYKKSKMPIIFKPLKKGFNKLSTRCPRCKIKFLDVQGHECPPLK